MNSPNRNIAIVRAVRDQGGTPTNVAKRFGISRQRVHQILNAYDAGGAEAIAPKSRAPHTHPHAVPDALRNEIIDKKILMVITDNHIITSLVETGEVLTEHYIETARDYQKAYWKHSDPPLHPEGTKPAPQNKNNWDTGPSSMSRLMRQA